jgi:hypothetical protein
MAEELGRGNKLTAGEETQGWLRTAGRGAREGWPARRRDREPGGRGAGRGAWEGRPLTSGRGSQGGVGWRSPVEGAPEGWCARQLEMGAHASC